jgi:hypothetical protein
MGELFQQRLCLFQIARVEILREPPVHRSQQFARSASGRSAIQSSVRYRWDYEPECAGLLRARAIVARRPTPRGCRLTTLGVSGLGSTTQPYGRAMKPAIHHSTGPPYPMLAAPGALDVRVELAAGVVVLEQRRREATRSAKAIARPMEL